MAHIKSCKRPWENNFLQIIFFKRMTLTAHCNVLQFIKYYHTTNTQMLKTNSVVSLQVKINDLFHGKVIFFTLFICIVRIKNQDNEIITMKYIMTLQITYSFCYRTYLKTLGQTHTQQSIFLFIRDVEVVSLLLLQVSTVQDALTTLCPEGPTLSTYPMAMEELSHVRFNECIFL